MTQELSQRAIHKIHDPHENFSSPVVVQVLNIKKIVPHAAPGPDRYRLILSDGTHYMQGMLATQLNDKVTDNLVIKNCIVRLTKYVCNPVGNKRILIILALDLISNAAEKIGVPVNIDAEEPKAEPNPMPVPQAKATDVKPIPPTEAPANGEIRATGFGEAVTMFYDVLQVDKVFNISKGSIKMANKQFSTVNNDYEMTIDNNTMISVCTDSSVPSIRYNALELSRLMEVEPNGTVDIIAIVKEASEAQTILTKKQTQVTKKELVLVDNSGWSVRCTLWGQQAENFSNMDRPVIALKGARVSDFNGRSISCADTTAVSVNPDIQEAYQLKGWYETTGISLNFESFSNEKSGTASGSASKSDVKTIAQVSDLGLGFGEKPDYFSIWGTITHIRNENAFYPACANPAGCNKKAMDLGGEWRCEKCDIQFPSPMWRYILSFCVCDEGGQMWMQLFNDEAEKLLGATANQLAELREINNTEYTETFERAVFTTHLFKCRAKNEVYQDEAKLRVTCISATPVDYRARSTELLNSISEISGVPL